MDLCCNVCVFVDETDDCSQNGGFVEISPFAVERLDENGLELVLKKKKIEIKSNKMAIQMNN